MTKSTLKPSPSMLFDILSESDPSRAKTKLRKSIELRGLHPEEQKTLGVVQSAHAQQIQVTLLGNSPEERQTQDDRAPAAGTNGRTAGDEEEEDPIEAAILKFTPVVILKELLGNLFIHPDMLEQEEMLGAGAYATVHKASMVSPDGSGIRTQVAVKRLKPEVLKGADDLKEFLMEGNLMRKLMHRHIVSVLGIGASELQSLESVRQSTYLVMEAADGGDLKTMVIRQMTGRSAVYDASDALLWCIHIASAMSYLHQVCKPMIIHRDLKLENCLLSSMGGTRVAKLADFGLHKRGRPNPSQGALTTPLDGSMHQSTAGGANNSMHDRSYYGGSMFANPGGKPGPGASGPGRDASVRAGSRAVAVAAPAPAPPPLSLREQASMISGGAAEGSVHEVCGSTHGGSAAMSVLLAQGYVQQDWSRHSRKGGKGQQAGSEQQQAKELTPMETLGPEAGKALGFPFPGFTPSSEGRPAASSMDAGAMPLLPGMVTSDVSLHRKMLALLALDRAANIETEASAAAAARSSLPAMPECDHWSCGPDVHDSEVGIAPGLLLMMRSNTGALPMSTIEEQAVSSCGRDTGGGGEGGGGAATTNALFQGPMEQQQQQAQERGKAGQERSGAPSAVLIENGPGDPPGPDMRVSASRGGSKKGSGRGVKASSTDSPSAVAIAAAATSRGGSSKRGSGHGMKAGSSDSPVAAAIAAAAAAAGLLKGKSKAVWNFADATQQVGSLMYMAPELFNGHVYNEKVDVFSFAILAFELFTGRLLSMRTDFMVSGVEAVEEYVKRRAQGERERIPGSWPPALQQLIASCWEHDPSARPAFSEVVRQLEAIQAAGVISCMKPRADLSNSCCIIM